MSERSKAFFTRHPVFKVQEFYDRGQKTINKRTQSALLQYYKREGRLIKIKDDLYAYVADEYDSKTFQVDPFLLISKLTDDAVIGYHSALYFWGRLHSERNNFVYLTQKRLSKSSFSFQGLTYKAISFPGKLLANDHELFGVTTVEREHMKIRVTSVERSFVDILDRPNLMDCDWEEIYRSLESIAYLDIDKVLEYTLLLENQRTAARVGFFLENFKEQLQIGSNPLKKLSHCIPKNPFYLDKNSKEPQKLISQWNLIAPLSVITKNWEEPYSELSD